MFSREKGFTIFEMLVVFAVIAVIAVLVLANYRQGQRQYALQQAAQRLVADLRQAQGMAVAGSEVSGYNNIIGYGIYILNNQSYILFLNNDAGGAAGNPKIYGGTSAQIKTVDLPKEVTIDNIGASIFFVPPQPKTYINGDPSSDSINITLTRGTNNQVVSVDKWGKIDMP